MIRRYNISSGAKWEEIVGYSRAVKIGSQFFISGTTAIDETGTIIGLEDPYQQTKYILKKIESILNENGFSIKDVVQTRLYVRNIKDWAQIGRAHAEYFKDIRPAATMVEVHQLIEPDILVEIEAMAVSADQ